MKLLVVAENENIKETLFGYTEIHGGSIIHYRHPLKCMDNYDEIEPDVIIFNAPDFPRHWKLAVQSLREKWDRKRALFLLLIEKDFPAEEADKAAYLGINALLTTEELEMNSYRRLSGLINRYRIAPERSDGPVFRLVRDPYPLMFMNPENLQFVSGKVERELMNRVLFFPSEPAAIAPIEAGTLLRNCSWERGGALETFDALVKKKGEYLELEIILSKEMKGIA